MSSILSLIYWLLNLFLIALIGRLILDYIRIFSPNFRPRGFLLALAELIYSVTDRPLSFVRQFVPPLRLGGISLDLSFIVVFFVVQLLMRLVVAL
ncbi:MAG: YggT family protein [Candidatus Nanopelagicus sp.]